MQVQFIGCGDALGSGGRANTCFHVTGKQSNLLIDCGASSLPAMKRLGIALEPVDLILITHFHGDHFGGLPFFLLDAQFSRRSRPLVIAGPAGIEMRLKQAMEVMFEHSSKTQQRFELSLVAFAPEETRTFGEVKVTPYPVVHGESGGPFLAYRVEAEGRVITYSADTEWTETLIPAARGADLFIAEAYYYDRIVKNHLSLITLEAHLSEINAKKLILTHMSDDMLGRLDFAAPSCGKRRHDRRTVTGPSLNSPARVTSAQVFAIAGPAMIANLTTPLIGIVSTTAIGRLGDATLLGGVAMASVLFDCTFWLFAFLRMSTVAFTAQSLGAGETRELHAILVRGLIVAGIVGVALIALQVPIAAILLGAMGGSEGVTRAAKTYFVIRIWSAPLALANYVVLGWLIGQARATLALSVQIAINIINMIATVLLVLVLDLGITGAAIAAVIAETAGLAIGGAIARRLTRGHPPLARAHLFEREKLMRMLSVNRDIMIRTASLIAAFLFFTAQGARAGDVTLAANAVLNNFLLISAFFLDGLANAAEQLCGRAYGARARDEFTSAVRLVVSWGFGFAIAVAAVFALFGPALIDMMTASPEVRRIARDFLIFVIASPVLAVFAFAFDGVYIGATWARDMRNLMVASLVIFLTAWLALRAFGNAGLWGALLVHYAARGGLEALRYPALLRKSFKS